MIYCDRSLLVAAFTNEHETELVHAWLAGQVAGSLCTSAWTITEFASALAIKVRTRELTTEARADVLGAWQRLRSESVLIAAVPSGAYDLAARFVESSPVSLRAADALHLAVVSLGAHSLATLDRKMADAAHAIGVPVQSISIDQRG